jgi:hypothetical protein
MDQLLQEINLLPGVLGCFVFNAKQQIAGSKMPPIFRENNLQTIGNQISRTLQMGQMTQMSFKEIEIKFNESLLISSPIGTGALLIIVCEPTANKSLISMTAGMLAGDIANSLANPMATHTAAPQAIQQQRQAPQSQDSQPKEAEIDANLASILEQVKDALAMAIGPIAGPIMKDTIEIWAQQGNPSFSNLSNLVKLLCKEINDSALEEEFMKTIKSIKN